MHMQNNEECESDVVFIAYSDLFQHTSMKDFFSLDSAYFSFDLSLLWVKREE